VLLRDYIFPGIYIVDDFFCCCCAPK